MSKSIETKKIDKVVVCQDGSVNVKDSFISSICPFDLSEMQKFNPTYLSGAYSEACDDKNKKKKSILRIRDLFSDYSFFNGIEEIKIDTLDELNIYLPIWFASVSSNGKTFTFVMNDTTNKWTNNVSIIQKENFFSKHAILSMIGIILLIPIIEIIGGLLLTVSIMLLLSCPLLIVAGIIIYFLFKPKRTNVVFENEKETFDVKVISHETLYEKTIALGDVPKTKCKRIYIDGNPLEI